MHAHRFALLFAFFIITRSDSFADQPNILWITAEDMSPTLGCYGDDYATTPNIDAFAKESVRYTQAFATAPICSPSRACLINGVYAQTQGAHNMRSAFPLAKELRGFPALLREKGYFTSNNVKTDYNSGSAETIIRQSWNRNAADAHWRQREEGTPFFSVFNLMVSHQSRTMAWPYSQFVEDVQSQLSPEEIHDPEAAPLPPYYPDSPIIRRTIARYYDCVTVMDKQVGAILKQLEDDGLADDTIVFFYSDHGSGMPRHKRALLDTGMKVPLLIRFPEKYKSLASGERASTTDQLVSFVDFAPTVLNLAGISIPDHMQGIAFLGREKRITRSHVFGHKDRVDEVVDLSRSIRDKRYLYIRNFMPHLGHNQPSAWPDQGEIREEIERLTRSRSMTPAQWHFAGPTRAVEELYDCNADPENLSNLAATPAHQETLKRLRSALREQLAQSKDRGFAPETLLWKEHDSPKSNKDRIDAAFDIGVANESRLLERLGSSDPAIRYLGALGLSASPILSENARGLLLKALDDSEVAVRIEASTALARHGTIDKALETLSSLLSGDLTVALHATRAIEMLGATARSRIPDMRRALNRARLLRTSPDLSSARKDLAWFIEFSASGFLSRHDDTGWVHLFDGRSLTGWTSRTKGKKGVATPSVSVVNGELQLLSKGPNLWLSHDSEWSDFELELEAHLPEAGYNSGIGFRCTSTGRILGYQCEIENAKSGMIYAIGKGWVWPKGKEEAAAFKRLAGQCFRKNEWNHFRILCVGERIQIWVNGTKTADLNDTKFATGSIAIQHHGKGAVHRFRNIRARRVHAKD